MSSEATIAIINYGMGNLRSVANAFEAVGARPVIADSPAALKDASHIVLPGVGAFGDGMANLRSGGWIDPIAHDVLENRKPFLGICLGMQLLATTGQEHGSHEGLGWIPGTARRLASTDASIRIPHIGWNDVRIKRDSTLLKGAGDRPSFYFVHSYVIDPDDEAVVTGFCDHGGEFAASLEYANIYAIQFHPEKSHRSGLLVLRNFAEVHA